MNCPDEQIISENRIAKQRESDNSTIIEKIKEVILSTMLVTDNSISEEELDFEDTSETSYRKGEFI